MVEVDVFRRKDVIKKIPNIYSHNNILINCFLKLGNFFRVFGYDQVIDFEKAKPIASMWCYAGAPRRGDQLFLNGKLHYVWHRVFDAEGNLDVLV